MVKVEEKYVLHGPEPYEPIKDKNLGFLIYNTLIKNYNDTEIMIDAHTKEVLTNKILLDKSCSLAETLRRNNYGKNTVVSIISENTLNYFIPILSCFYIGAVVAPLNPNYTINELKHSLNISKPKIIFCSKKVVKKILEVKSLFNFIEKIVLIDSNDSNSNISTLEELTNLKYSPYDFKPINETAENLMALIMCSSGTTGLPKGVLLSQNNVVLRLMYSRDPRYKASNSNDAVLGILPFFHVFGFTVTLACIVNSFKMILLKHFEEDLFLKTIQDFRINNLTIAPPLAVFLAKSPKVFNYDLSSLKYLRCGAAPLSKVVEESLKERLKIKNISQAYGLTECTVGVTSFQKDDKGIGVLKGSSGKLNPYFTCKIRDPETGKSLEPFKVGEICLKGPSVMVGYYGNVAATKETFTKDGWLRTGDLAYYDKEEYIYIVDRLKEVIKYKGYQVAPAELEAVLIEHPKILDVGVVGLPDELSGELPLAFVVKKPGVTVTEEEIIKYVEDKVSSQKRLRGGVIFVTEIPKNPSGKILRRKLRELLKPYKSKL